MRAAEFTPSEFVDLTLLVNTINAWNRVAIAFRKMLARGLAHLLWAGPIAPRSRCNRKTLAAGDCFRAHLSTNRASAQGGSDSSRPADAVAQSRTYQERRAARANGRCRELPLT